ncbi:class I lanthipeptide [Kordia jejudonensis]|uniref:class I lanthipeptide n=1 Tax=Kordia jejudonensis TaxID=1348245 RepID=UPI000629C06E|nr:class I lanthipeptide [Kordia jejudonensis]
MKKNKKSVKKLSLNKNVISNLENNQVVGGTVVTLVVCPVVTRFNCPILTPACPILTNGICPILTPACPIITADCSLAGCPSDFIC